MSSFTKGPWEVCGGYSPQFTAIHSAAGYIIFSMADANHHREKDALITAPDYETQRANAHLIASAPDLYEALKKCVAQLKEVRDGTDFECECWSLADEAAKALAKAEGRGE